jgi:hypothetical protein
MYIRLFLTPHYIHTLKGSNISPNQDHSTLTLPHLRDYNYLTQSHMICYNEICLLRRGSNSFPTLPRRIYTRYASSAVGAT